LLPIFRKKGKFAVSIKRPKAKVFQLQGGFVSWSPSPSDHPSPTPRTCTIQLGSDAPFSK